MATKSLYSHMFKERSVSKEPMSDEDMATEPVEVPISGGAMAQTPKYSTYAKMVKKERK